MTSPPENAISPGQSPNRTVAEQTEAPPVEQKRETTSAQAATTPVSPKGHSSRSGETLLQSLLSIIVIVLFVITFIVQAFQIPSPSMEKTLLVGDYLLVDKLHFGEGGSSGWFLPYREIRRGDIVVFHYPVDPSQHFVKRVVGIPGDHLRLHDKTLYVNDLPAQEPYAVHEPGDQDRFRDNFPSENDSSGQVDWKWHAGLQQHLQQGEIVVPQGQYFVMGDNRDHSLDSRYWGFVPRENIVGRPLVIYLSVRRGQEDTIDSNDKLSSSGHLLTHVWQFARWDRMFHLVR